MKRAFRIAVFSILSLGLTSVAVPAQAAGRSTGDQLRVNQGAHYQAASWHDDDRNHRSYREDRNDEHDRYERGRSYRGDRDGSGYYRGDDGYYGSYQHGYADPGYYPSAQYYDGGGYYYDRDGRAGRSAAIIGGSAAAGAVIGAAAGHGQGAAIGAIVGGIAGAIADQAVRHHDYR